MAGFYTYPVTTPTRQEQEIVPGFPRNCDLKMQVTPVMADPFPSTPEEQRTVEKAKSLDGIRTLTFEEFSWLSSSLSLFTLGEIKIRTNKPSEGIISGTVKTILKDVLYLTWTKFLDFFPDVPLEILEQWWERGYHELEVQIPNSIEFIDRPWTLIRRILDRAADDAGYPL